MRIKALLRRTPIERTDILRIADLELNRLTQQVKRGVLHSNSWLHRIAINSANTVLALRARQSSLFASDLFTSDDGRDKADEASALNALDTPEDLALTEELCGAVNAAIEALPDEQRTAIGLYELRGLSYAQVAAAMSRPVGTVRSACQLTGCH